MTWHSETLQAIDQADDLKIAPFRADGKTTGTPTWIWEVIVDNRLFVRAYSGIRSSWYQAAVAQQAGKIHAAGQVFNVHFTPIRDHVLNERISAAYRQKYAQSPYMAHMIGTGAQAATIEILFNSEGALR
mgnify:CR=1 FL=1